MSRTDKDRPYRIREFFGGEVKHDHRNGECVIETFTDAKAGYLGRYHYSRCNKRSRVPDDCPGAGWGWGQCRIATKAYSELDIYERLRYSRDPSRFKCDTQHTKFVYDPDAPCTGCDDIEARRRVTCEYTMPADKRAYYRYASPPPAWFVKHVYHSPMRRDARDVLRGAARDYNTYGETDADEGLECLHQHSAKWLWW